MYRQQTIKTSKHWVVGALLAASGVLMTGAAFAQTGAGVYDMPPGYGIPSIKTQASHMDTLKFTYSTYTYSTQDQSVYTVPVYAMQPYYDTPILNNGLNRYIGPGNQLVAPIQLPSGASIKSIEVQGCDNSSSTGIEYLLYEAGPNGTFNRLSPVFSTGKVDAVGCSFYSGSLPTPHTVDNYSSTYYVGVNNTSADTTVGAVRIYYRLPGGSLLPPPPPPPLPPSNDTPNRQVPPPATATFNDVPKGHIFYRAVEALAASGITGGCGNSNFCPNAVVARGQMAAFLARALDL